MFILAYLYKSYLTHNFQLKNSDIFVKQTNFPLGTKSWVSFKKYNFIGWKNCYRRKIIYLYF